LEYALIRLEQSSLSTPLLALLIMAVVVLLFGILWTIFAEKISRWQLDMNLFHLERNYKFWEKYSPDSVNELMYLKNHPKFRIWYYRSHGIFFICVSLFLFVLFLKFSNI
jgi:hypothetical protein